MLIFNWGYERIVQLQLIGQVAMHEDADLCLRPPSFCPLLQVPTAVRGLEEFDMCTHISHTANPAITGVLPGAAVKVKCPPTGRN